MKFPGSISVLIIVFIIVCGCNGTATTEQNITTTPVPVTITIVQTTPAPITEIPTPIPTTEPTVEITQSTPEPTQTYVYPKEPLPPTQNITEGMNWTEYTNNTDFGLKYPEGWTVSNTTFSSWSNRVVSTPEIYKQIAKDVKFKSQNGLTWFNARVYDFIAPGGHKLNQNIEPIKEQITKACPDVSGDSAISNHRLFVDDYKYTVMDFDVKIPESSDCSPLEYSERTFVTYNHLYVFDFVTTEAHIEEYKNVRDMMMRSIVPENQVAYRNGYSKI